jgi:hypothetical protein
VIWFFSITDGLTVLAAKVEYLTTFGAASSGEAGLVPSRAGRRGLS